MTIIFAAIGITAFLALALRFPGHAGSVTGRMHSR
jgi:hypothetical protein